MEEYKQHPITGQITDQNGYIMLRMTSHPHTHDGYVARARHVMEQSLGRYLAEGERVWHQDHNRQNDAIENLALTCPKVLPIIECPICHKRFQPSQAKIRHCSPACGQIATYRCAHPPKDVLQWLVWERPVSTLQHEFSVSDVAIAKWCKRSGVIKPHRGYWAKVHAGVIKHVNPYPRPRPQRKQQG